MTTYSTQNPLGSSDPRDLYDNAENLDNFVNGAQPAYDDRLGKPRRSWQSVEDQADQQQSEFDSAQAQRSDEFDADQTERAGEFDVAQSYRASQYIAAEDARNFQTNEFIANHGNYVPVGDYDAGIEITEYNQVVRDADGEFWRVTGSQGLPYSTTGGGLPEGGVFVPVGDAALRQQLAQDNGYRLVSNQMAPNAYGIPGKLTNVTTSTVTIKPCGYFDNLLWGSDASRRLHSSSDMGVTWTLVSSVVPRTPEQAFRTTDGEVLTQSGSGLGKSSGWAANPATATWSIVLDRPAGNVANFLKWGTDGDGQKFIATHYSSTRSDSRYVWISTDAGSTFTQVYDSNVNDPVEGPGSHIHAACYDAWADRFYFCEGHAGIVGVYYSDDDGANWTKMTSDTVNGSTMSPAFTTMTATDFGIVCGTDTSPNGVWLLRRTANPDDVGIEFMGQISKAEEGVQGFFDHSFRDPDTGIVYLGFANSRGNYAIIPEVIMACGAAGASIIYAAASDRVYSVFAAEGKIVAQVGTGTTWLRADTSKGSFFGDYIRAQDRGNLGIGAGEFTREKALRIGLEAKAEGLRSIAIGRQATASEQFNIAIGDIASTASDGSVSIGHQSTATNQYSLAIGMNATTTGARGISVGYSSEATSTNGVAVGQSSSASQGVSIGGSATSSATGVAIGGLASASAGVALGRSASVSANGSVAIGGISSVSSVKSIALGEAASVTGADSIAIGNAVSVSNTFSVAIGNGAVAGTNYSTAIGVGAKANHLNSAAFGAASETQKDNSVNIGNRNIESMRPGGGLFLRSPDGSAWLVRVSNAGEIEVLVQ